MPDKKTDRPTWLRYSGIGIEFAAAVAGFALVGYWIDKRYQSSPWGVVIGTALGLIGGTYNLIRESLAAFQPPESPGDSNGDHSKNDGGRDDGYDR